MRHVVGHKLTRRLLVGCSCIGLMTNLATEADLGTFSMFGPNRGPHKKGPPTGQRMLDSSATFSGLWWPGASEAI